MTRHRPPMVPLAIAVLLIAGCSSLLAPLPDRTRYYVLSAAPKAADVSGSAVEVDFTVGLGPLEIPDYLNRSERAVRLGPNRMRFHENERWAEALDASTLRVLLQDLAARLGNARVIALPTLVVDAAHVRRSTPDSEVRFDGERRRRAGGALGNQGQRHRRDPLQRRDAPRRARRRHRHRGGSGGAEPRARPLQ